MPGALAQLPLRPMNGPVQGVATNGAKTPIHNAPTLPPFAASADPADIVPSSNRPAKLKAIVPVSRTNMNAIGGVLKLGGPANLTSEGAKHQNDTAQNRAGRARDSLVSNLLFVLAGSEEAQHLQAEDREYIWPHIEGEAAGDRFYENRHHEKDRKAGASFNRGNGPGRR